MACSSSRLATSSLLHQQDSFPFRARARSTTHLPVQTNPTGKMAHSHDNHSHSHDHAHSAVDHGHSHEILDGPGSYLGREMPLVHGRDFSERAFTVGIGGYVLVTLIVSLRVVYSTRCCYLPRFLGFCLKTPRMAADISVDVLPDDVPHFPFITPSFLCALLS